MSDFVVVIPARYGSTRLPGKALVDIAGKPMVVHVAERAQRSGAREVWIATDDQRILDAAHEHGYQACMTRPDHTSGTDRIAEVAASRGWSDSTIVVNVQGDEPRIAPELIREVAAALDLHGEASMSTACHPIHRAEDLFDPNCVKVVLDHRGDALYFSRATIPWARDALCAGPHFHSSWPARSTATSASTHIAAASCNATRRCPLQTSSASKRWSSYAPCGMAIESPWRLPHQPRKLESTRRRIWKPCVVCLPKDQ